jgi:hypothetical protein
MQLIPRSWFIRSHLRLWPSLRSLNWRSRPYSCSRRYHFWFFRWWFFQFRRLMKSLRHVVYRRWQSHFIGSQSASIGLKLLLLLFQIGLLTAFIRTFVSFGVLIVPQNSIFNGSSIHSLHVRPHEAFHRFFVSSLVFMRLICVLKNFIMSQLQIASERAFRVKRLGCVLETSHILHRLLDHIILLFLKQLVIIIQKRLLILSFVDALSHCTRLLWISSFHSLFQVQNLLPHSCAGLSQCLWLIDVLVHKLLYDMILHLLLHDPPLFVYFPLDPLPVRFRLGILIIPLPVPLRIGHMVESQIDIRGWLLNIKGRWLLG